MPAITPNRGYPYQTITDSPAGHLLGQNLATAIDADVAALYAQVTALAPILGNWTPYVPAWTSTGTPPAIGNGLLEGRFMHAGKLAVATGRMLAGTTTTFGTGVYSMSLPVASESGLRHMGAGVALDTSTPTNNGPVTVRMDGTLAIRFYGVGGQVTNTVPFTWADTDSLIWTTIYATN
jgi:hypothetical protein